MIPHAISNFPLSITQYLLHEKPLWFGADPVHHADRLYCITGTG